MPHRRTIRRSVALPLFALASCVSPPKVVPPPAPPPVIAPPAAPVGDAPPAAGRWTYRAGATPEAVFAGADGVPAFALRCDPARRLVVLVRLIPAPTATTMTVTTSYGPRALPATGGGAGAQASLSARDPFLDRMAFSRGRIAITLDGGALLAMPAWAEIGRVVEDCRG